MSDTINKVAQGTIAQYPTTAMFALGALVVLVVVLACYAYYYRNAAKAAAAAAASTKANFATVRTQAGGNAPKWFYGLETQASLGAMDELSQYAPIQSQGLYGFENGMSLPTRATNEAVGATCSSGYVYPYAESEVDELTQLSGGGAMDAVELNEIIGGYAPGSGVAYHDTQRTDPSSTMLQGRAPKKAANARQELKDEDLLMNLRT